MKHYNLVVCGGTFDHFHKGHKAFLTYAFSCSKKLLIGLTSDSFVNITKDSIEPYEVRNKALEKFIASQNATEKAEIMPIDNIFGPTLQKDLLIDALLVSEETKKGAELINQKRVENGLEKLSIIVFPFTLAQDRKPISSSRIRGGEIDRNGKLYVRGKWFDSELTLPTKSRSQLAKPFGLIIKDIGIWIQNEKLDPRKIITVGDVVTKSFNELSMQQKISVLDFRVARQNQFTNIHDHGFLGNEQVLHAKNPPGTLTPSLFQTIDTLKKDIEEKNQIILVIDGEEDLSVLPLVLTFPLGYTIFYGQPGEGVVMVEISETTKRSAYAIVDSLFEAK